MNRARGLALACVIAVVGSGAWLVSRAPVLAPRVDASPDAGRAGFVLGFVPGHETTYDVSYRSDGALSVGDGDAGALASSFHARLVRTVLADATTGNHVVLYRFLDARVVLAVNDTNVEQEARDVAASLATGVVAEHAAAGQVVVLRFAPSSTALSRSFARALLSWIQITLPRELAPTWSARETDTNGAYVAGYTRVGEDGALRKTKRTGAASDDQGGFPVAVHGATHYRSILEIDFDLERGGMKEIAGEEWVETFFGAFSLGTTRSTFEATRSNERTLEPAVLSVLTEETRTTREAAPTTLDAHDPTARLTARKEASERWLGKATLPEILRDLHAEAAAQNVDRQFSVFLRLTSYAFLHPEACARIAKLLPSLAPSGDEAMTILQALGATGSSEAQSALASVLLASTTKLALRLRIVPTLGMLAHPSEESEAALRRVRDEGSDANLAATASLGLGIMAHALALESPRRASLIVDEALAKTATERDEQLLVLDLSALGNTGSPRIVAAATEWSRAPSSAIRAQAAFALRLVPSEDAEARLLAMLESEADVAVRARVARALSYRDPSKQSFTIQSERARVDPDASLRAALLENIYAMREELPAATSIVAARATEDPDANVRRFAAALAVH